jgi:uncharacterized SAM-binding protein YcdF (DUF218 family)
VTAICGFVAGDCQPAQHDDTTRGFGDLYGQQLTWMLKWPSRLWRIVWRSTIAVLAACGALLLIVRLTPLSDWVIDPLLVRRDLTKSDAIVLLTAWASPDRVLNDPGLRRTLDAAQLYKQGVAQIVVISGRNRSSGSGPTAEVMAELLIDMGVPRAALMVDTESTNTHESAVNITRLARSRSWHALTVVSDPIDMRRALASFRHEGATARAGADVRTALRSPPGFYRLLQLEAAAHEWMGLLYYWWMDWI